MQKLRQIAAQKLAEFKQDRKNGKQWSEWVEEYLVVHQLSDKTANAYRLVLKPYGFDNSKNMSMLVDSIQSGVNVVQKIRIVKAFFGWLIQNGVPVINPAANVRVPTVQARSRTLTLDEVQTYYRELESATPECALFGRLLLETGARVSSVFNIKIGDLKDGMLQLWNVKCRRPYSIQVPISDKAMELWSQVVQNRPQESDDALFASKCHVLTHKIRTILNRLFNEDTPRERVVIHTLRHTTATLALEAGVPMSTVSQMLDHRNVNTTYAFYAKTGQLMMNKAFGALLDFMNIHVSEN